MVSLDGQRFKGLAGKVKGKLKAKAVDFKSDWKKKKILKSIAKKEVKKIQATEYVKRRIEVAKAVEKAKTKHAIKIKTTRIESSALINPLDVILGTQPRARENVNNIGNVLGSLTGYGSGKPKTVKIKLVKVRGKKKKAKKGRSRTRYTYRQSKVSSGNPVLDNLV